jgi:hypothetical protein
VQGNKCYDDAQKNLDIAVREYDQAVLHLATRVISGALHNFILLTKGLNYKQNIDQKEKQDEMFLKRLSPLYWLVEAQLHSFRQQRGENTLQWARDLQEFQNL